MAISFIQSNCGAYELLFCDVAAAKQIPSATELKDVRWSSQTCTLGWSVQGIWEKGIDGSDINALSRSNTGHLLAIGDDFGKVRVFRSPCPLEGAQSIALSGHSSHVMNVRWSSCDEYIVSVGGEDKTVMLWRHSMLEGAAGGTAGAVENIETAKAEGILSGHGVSGGGESKGELDAPSGGDESTAVKPWLGAIRPPKVLPTMSSLAPSQSLQLSWVHGYTSGAAGSDNTRVGNNLFYNSDGDAVYPAAALGVRLSYKESPSSSGAAAAGSGSGSGNSGPGQRYFNGHDDDILCLSISPCRKFVATGQTASKSTKGKASVCIWDAAQCRLLSKLESCHQRAGD